MISVEIQTWLMIKKLAIRIHYDLMHHIVEAKNDFDGRDFINN